MTPLAQGFHHRLSADRYHADNLCEKPSLSSGLAQVLMSESPFKAWFSHPRLNPAYRAPEDDGKFDIGTTAHALLLEGIDKIVECDFPDWRTKDARLARDAARGQGKVPLLLHQAHGVRAMVAEALRFIAGTEIRNDWQDSDAEITGVWEEEGFWFRIRPDILSVDRRITVNYKTTTDASPEAFSRQIVRMGYDFGDAFYRRGIQQITGHDPKSLLLAQSTEAPYECSLHGCDESLREIADYNVEHVIELWKHCMKANNWPSHGPRIHWATPATWQIKEHEQRMAA